MNTPTTKTEIAKWAAQAVVAAKVARFAKDQVEDYTQYDRDNVVVDVGCSVIGYQVASKLRPYTDKAVDVTIERYQAWRARKNETSTPQ